MSFPSTSSLAYLASSNIRACFSIYVGAFLISRAGISSIRFVATDTGMATSETIFLTFDCTHSATDQAKPLIDSFPVTRSTSLSHFFPSATPSQAPVVISPSSQVDFHALYASPENIPITLVFSHSAICLSHSQEKI